MEAYSEAGDSGFGSTGLVEPFDNEHELTSQDDIALVSPGGLKSLLQGSQYPGMQSANSGLATPTQPDNKQPSVFPASSEV